MNYRSIKTIKSNAEEDANYRMVAHAIDKTLNNFSVPNCDVNGDLLLRMIAVEDTIKINNNHKHKDKRMQAMQTIVEYFNGVVGELFV